MSFNQNNSLPEKYDIIFLGLAQNCEQHIDKFFNIIEILSHKLKLHVMIGENNSNDFTFDKIKKFQNKTKVDFKFVDTTFIEQYPDRIKRLASARQKLKENILELKIESDYVCVVDLDDVLNNNFNDKLIHSLIEILKINRLKYFAVSVSSKPYYYDILNFESSEFPNLNIKQLQNNRTLNSYTNRKKYIYDVQKKISKKKSFECISAFNGLCLYIYEDFIKSSYLEDSIDVTPEHLYLNRNINKVSNKSILVTDFHLQMPNEHKPIGNILSFIFEKIFKFASIFLLKVFKNE